MPASRSIERLTFDRYLRTGRGGSIVYPNSQRNVYALLYKVMGIAAVLLAAAVPLPQGVPFADSPVPHQTLRELEVHRWGEHRIAYIFDVLSSGIALDTMYAWGRPATESISMSNHVYFTQHAGTIIMSYTGVWLRYPEELDPPKPDETCFTSYAIRWTARHLYLRKLDVAGTRRANPWLDRRPTGDDSCPLALGHLSPADQARLTLRWGREESVGLAPVPPPPIPAIGPPTYVPDANDHPATEPAPAHR